MIEWDIKYLEKKTKKELLILFNNILREISWFENYDGEVKDKYIIESVGYENIRKLILKEIINEKEDIFL